MHYVYCRRLICSCLVGQLHFAHPSAYNEIYSVQNKWDKDYKLYRAFDMDESFFVQSSYLKSKHNRALLSNFFSKQTISDLQHLIRSMVRGSFTVSHVSAISFESSWTNSATASKPKTRPVSSQFASPLDVILTDVQESPATCILASNVSVPTRSPISVLLPLSISSLSQIFVVTLSSALTLLWTHSLCENSLKFLYYSSATSPNPYLPAYLLR